MRRLLCLLIFISSAPASSQTAKQDLSVPNIYGEASEELIQELVRREVDQIDPFFEQVGEATIVGSVRATAKTRMEMVPNPDRAVMHLVVDGSAFVDATISRKPVELFVSTVLRFQGRSPMIYDVKGVRHSPAKVCGRFTDTRLHCVTTQFRGMSDRVAKRIAKFIFNRQIDDKLYEALPEAIEKIRESFDKETIPELQKLNKDYDVLLKVAKNAHVDVKQVFSSTSADRLFVNWVIGTPNQPVAKTEPPPLTGKRDMAFRIHQNVLNEVAKANVAGQDTTIKELQEILGPLAATLKPNPKAKRWHIRFAKVTPVSVAFGKQQMSLVLRTQEIGSETNVFRRPMNLHVGYRIEKSEKGIALVRIGRVDPRPPWFPLKPGKEYPPAIQKEREWIRNSLEKTFADRVVLTPIKLARDKKDAGELVPIDLRAEAGWLAAAWVRADSKKSK